MFGYITLMGITTFLEFYTFISFSCQLVLCSIHVCQNIVFVQLLTKILLVLYTM